MSLLANRCVKASARCDAALLESKLGKIDGGEELGAHIIDIVKAKEIASWQGLDSIGSKRSKKG